MPITQIMFKYHAVGALLHRGEMTRTAIAEATGVDKQEVLMVERIQDKNQKVRAFWNWKGQVKCIQK